MNGFYYGQYTRKLVVAFGALFNNIYVQTVDNGQTETTRVPLTYAPKEKFVRRLLEESSIVDNTKIGIRLPQLSFALNDITVDPARRRNKVNEELFGTVDGKAKRVLVEVPVNVNFNLYIYTRQITHTLQIIEQIIPYFNPEYILKINFDDPRQNSSVPLIMMNGIKINERYDGDFGSRRINMSSIAFVAKSFITAPILETGTDEMVAQQIIEQLDIDIIV